MRRNNNALARVASDMSAHYGTIYSSNKSAFFVFWIVERVHYCSVALLSSSATFWYGSCLEHTCFFYSACSAAVVSGTNRAMQTVKYHWYILQVHTSSNTSELKRISHVLLAIRTVIPFLDAWTMSSMLKAPGTAPVRRRTRLPITPSPAESGDVSLRLDSLPVVSDGA